MPYIAQANRDRINAGGAVEMPGELNYVITSACVAYLKAEGLSYGTINDIIGALESAKLEFYRRVAAPYEETKINTNGDCYV